MADHDIPDVGDKPEGLSQNQHRIEPEKSVSNNNGRAQQADDPEADRKRRLVMGGRIDELINETKRKDYLACGSEYQQP
jgi:hypothetical protein